MPLNMRRLTLAGWAALLLWAVSVGAQARDAATVLAAARQALGGDASLGAVKTFVATGRTRQLRGNNLVPIEFEIDAELPDKYVRHDEFPAQDQDVTVSGFSGNEVIFGPPPPAGRGGPPPAQRLLTVRQDFARLMLGVFAGSFSSFPLTFTYAAEGEAPEGKADVLAVSGPPPFAAQLVVQRDTHLPVLLIWQTPVPPGGARAGGPPAPSAGPGAPVPGPPPENRLYFADHRDVNGIKWPFRIRRAVGGNTIEETTFDRVRINVKIDPKKFEAPR
jgi:hypothetical protein